MAYLHQDRCHIVTAETATRAQILGTALIHQVLNTLDQILDRLLLVFVLEVVFVDLLVHIIHCVLRCFDIPNAVAGQQHELSVLGDLDALDVWESGHSLIFCLQHPILLVLKIAKRS